MMKSLNLLLLMIPLAPIVAVELPTIVPCQVVEDCSAEQGKALLQASVIEESSLCVQDANSKENLESDEVQLALLVVDADELMSGVQKGVKNKKNTEINWVRSTLVVDADELMSGGQNALTKGMNFSDFYHYVVDQPVVRKLTFHPTTNLQSILAYAANLTNVHGFQRLEKVNFLALSLSLMSAFECVIPLGTNVRKYVFNVFGLQNRGLNNIQKFHMLIATIRPFLPSDLNSDMLYIKDDVVHYCIAQGVWHKQAVQPVFHEDLKENLDSVMSAEQVAYLSLLIGSNYAFYCRLKQKNWLVRSVLDIVNDLLSPTILSRFPLNEEVSLPSLIAARSAWLKKECKEAVDFDRYVSVDQGLGGIISSHEHVPILCENTSDFDKQGVSARVAYEKSLRVW